MQNSEKNLTHVDKILTILDKLDVHTQLEILANVFIALGVQSHPNLPAGHVRESELWDIVLSEKESKQETIFGALIHQGLLVLAWIDNIKEK